MGYLHVFAGPYADNVWLITDTEPVLYEVQRQRRSHFRADVAGALATPAARLVMQPVRPMIHDAEDHGRLVRNVLLALEGPFPCPSDPARHTPVLLDLRPIQLGFGVAFAAPAGFDRRALAMRLAGFCPAPFTVEIFQGDSPQPSLLDLIQVDAGSVLVVEFLLPAAPDARGSRDSSVHGMPAAGPETTVPSALPPASNTGQRATDAQARTAGRSQSGVIREHPLTCKESCSDPLHRHIQAGRWLTWGGFLCILLCCRSLCRSMPFIGFCLLLCGQSVRHHHVQLLFAGVVLGATPVAGTLWPL